MTAVKPDGPATGSPLDEAPAAVRAFLAAHLTPDTLDRVRSGAIDVDQAVTLIVDAIGAHSVDACHPCRAARDAS